MNVLGHPYYRPRWKSPKREGKDQRYEREKAAWTAAHPEATAAEYEAAIREICKRIGY